MPAMSTQVAQVDYPALLDEAWQQHLAPRDDDAPTVISTFAGCSGSSLGYSMAGYRELLAVEWDDNAVETFKLNFPGVPVYHGDIVKLTAAKCCKLAGVKPGELDILDGSPPCQGFSTAGKRDIDDDRNQLFREFVRLLQGLKPKVFVMENVSGMVKGKMKLVFAECLRELKASGYRVSARLMNAMYFNVPQSRQRLIFVGARADLDAEPSHPVAQTRPRGVTLDYSGEYLSARDEQIARAHKTRHAQKGNGFGFQLIDSRYPTNTFPKTKIAASCPILISHQGRLKWPSSRELKRIASYPAKFCFAGTYNQQWARIGNSVPPLFMRAIAQHIKQEILFEA